MQFYIDSGDPAQIESWCSIGVTSGVTMNPLILKAQGVTDVRPAVEAVLDAAGKLPVSIQVSSCEESTLRREAAEYAELGDNVVVKVPIHDVDGRSMLPLIADLTREGVSINATACMNAMQAIMAALAGAEYVSLFAGRINDEGGDAKTQIRRTRDWIDQSRSQAKIITGSVRQPGDVYHALEARTHIVTVPPTVLAKSIDHSFTRRTVAQFEEAAR